MNTVPVVDKNQKPLMPTSPRRARRWVQSRKATPFWKHGVWCVRLNVEPSGRNTQPIAVGIDPGSKREGITVMSEAHTYINLNCHARVGIKEKIEARRNMRRSRRNRKTPCRKNRINRARGSLAPSTKARWGWKLRLAQWLAKMFPIAHFVVEDIAASTKSGQKRWNRSFSPLEIGKAWFYGELGKLAPVSKIQGYDTKKLRDQLGLKKTHAKLAETFNAHCVDSWVLANWWVGGHLMPDNTRILCVAPLEFNRRQLHLTQPAKGGLRKRYGGTMSLGFKRGSLVKHPKWGICYVGGNMGDRISLHSLTDGKRLTQTAKTAHCRFRAYNSWRCWLPVNPLHPASRACSV